MSPNLAWTFLIVSGLVDVAWAYSVKRADGLAHPGWFMVSLVLLATFIGLLTKALQVLPLGVAYAVWTGIGAVGAVTAGFIFFGEQFDWLKLLAIALVIGGVIMLRLTTT